MVERAMIGVIAGRGHYPHALIEAMRRDAPAMKIIMVAFHGETSEEVAALADEVEWASVGQLSKPLKFFKKHGVSEVIMAGQLAPKNLYQLRPDLRTVKMLARLSERNAESLFGAVAEEMAKEGIRVLPATSYLEDRLPGPGAVFGPKLNAQQLQDAEYGFRIAKETSRLDIGQAVVVRRGTVLAVEAFEGTNDCIRRGGKLAQGKGGMLVKVSKPRQDFRFDVPVVGPRTIEVCADSGVDAIVIEANRIMLLDWERVEELCKKKRVSLYSIGLTAAEDRPIL